MSNEVITPNPKIWRKSLALFGFQCAAGLLMGVLIYIFTDVIKILPGSLIAHGSSMPATIFGAYCYGYWEERLHPGILRTSLVKKICRITVIGQFVLILIFLLILQAVGSALSIEFIICITFFIALIFLIYYWLSIKFIILGISKRLKGETSCQAG